MTSIIDLGQAEFAAEPGAPDAMEAVPIETVTDFESLDSLGTLEHTVEEPAETTPETPPPQEELPPIDFLTIASEPATEPAIEPLVETAVVPVIEAKKDLGEVKKYAEKISIGKPKIEANPPYSLLASGQFTEEQQRLIIGVVSGQNLGIHPDELTVQLSMGKLLIPRISEYAAIFIAQKIRDIVTDLKIDLSENVFMGKVGTETHLNDEPLISPPAADNGENIEFSDFDSEA